MYKGFGTIVGAIAFVWALTKAIVEVQIDENK